jgi:hypothetical protein
VFWFFRERDNAFFFGESAREKNPPAWEPMFFGVFRARIEERSSFKGKKPEERRTGERSKDLKRKDLSIAITI